MRALLLVVLGACTTFTPIEANVCGNGILEPGEDCDTPDATCVACAITCTTTSECPGGLACGVDRTCHGPGGRLGEAKPIDAVSVTDFRMTDVDGDGFDDFVGLSSTSLTVRHGDPAGSLATNESFVTPSQTGAPAFGDLDGDKALDFILPTLDGLVVYTSKYGEPSPVAVPATLIDKSVQVVSIVPLTATIISVFVAPVPTAAVPNPDVSMLVVDFSDPSTPANASVTLCDAHTPFLGFDASSLDVYDASPSNATASTSVDFVLSFLSGAQGKRACVLDIHLDPPTSTRRTVTATVVPITPPGLGAVLHRPVLAQLDYAASDNCPHLVFSDAGAADVIAYDASIQISGTTVSHCGFAAVASHIALAGANATDFVVGRVPLKPQFFLVGGDALVAQGGLWLYVPLTKQTTQLYASTRPIRSAIAGDINGDGLTDAVLIPDGADDLDLLLRFHDTSHTPNDGYEFLRIDTATQASNVTLQDFDGNGHLDIAYSEHAGDHDRIMIAYGTADLPLPPTQVAAFDAIGDVVPIALASSADPLSLSADLFVTVPNTSPPLLTVLLGSPQRTMIPLLDPRTGPAMTCPTTDDPRDHTIFRAIVIGDFLHDPGATQFADTLAVTNLRPGAVMTSPTCPTPPPETSGWRIAGSASGLDTAQSGGKAVTGLVDCDVGPPGANEMCTQATYLAFPTSAQHDVAIGIDRFNNAAIADASSGSFALSTTTAFKTAGDATVHTAFAADLDGDGTKELVAAFAPGTTSKGAVLVCPMDPASGAPGTCTDISATVKAASGTIIACVGATPGHFGFTGPTAGAATGTDLVVACYDTSGTSLFRVAPDRSVTKLASGLALRTSLLRTGDVNGDGVDDVIAIDGGSGGQTLQVLLQCTSRDSACKEAP